MASEPVELPGSGSAARPLAEGDRQEPVTVVAQVWVSLEEGLLVGPSKTDYPLEVFVQETRPVPPGSSSCGARPCAPYLAVGGAAIVFGAGGDYCDYQPEPSGQHGQCGALELAGYRSEYC